MKNIVISISILTLLLVIAPVFLTDYGVLLTTEIAIIAIFAMSLGLIMGYAGMISLGHAAFFGIGAYVVAILSQYVANTYILLIAAMSIAGIIAFVTGAIFIRTSSFSFLMITLAFGQMLYALFFQSTWAGRSDGMGVQEGLNFGFGEVYSPIGFYYTMGIAFIFLYLFLRFFVGSPVGKITKGIMENESRMKALGYNPRFYKVLAYTISGAIAGLAGSLYAFFNLFVSPDLTNWAFSGQVLIMVIIGGVGTLLGPALGAGIYIILQNVVSTYTDRWVLILGVILIALVLVGRGGVVNWFSALKEKFRNNEQLPVHRPKLNVESEGKGDSIEPFKS